MPLKGQIPIRERLSKWQEHNPQTYQQSLPEFKEGKVPLELLSELLRKPTSVKGRQAETAGEETEGDENVPPNAVQNDGDTSILIEEIEPGDLIDTYVLAILDAILCINII